MYLHVDTDYPYGADGLASHTLHPTAAHAHFPVISPRAHPRPGFRFFTLRQGHELIASDPFGPGEFLSSGEAGLTGENDWGE